MRITIVGGGNIGTQFAVHCSHAGHIVKIYTSTPSVFEKEINIVDEYGEEILSGYIEGATNDPEVAFRDANVVIVTIPANHIQKYAEEIYKYSSSKVIICVVPGGGGSECAFRKCIERGNTFFGLERVPAIARLIKKGKTVRSIGYRKELHVSSLPADKSDECCQLIENIFNIHTIPIPCYLNFALTPSNPILHTTRLKTIFRDYEDGFVYESLPLFYEEWNNESSILLLQCDDEVQSICRKLSGFRLNYVKSLKEHYESSTPQEMTEKIRSIKAFRGISTPAVEWGGGLIPDLHSRYFTADFSYGLSIIKQIAVLADVNTPFIDEVLSWYKKIAKEKKEFSYSEYGITSLDRLKSFYLS